MLLNAEILLVRHFGNPGARAYIMPNAVVALHYGGIVDYRFHSTHLRQPGPFLVIHAQGTAVQMVGSEARDSWGVNLTGDAVRPAPDTGTVEVQAEKGMVKLPALTPLSPQDAAIWRREFQELHACFRSPTPEADFRLRLGVATVLRHIIDTHRDRQNQSPAGRLKHLIDEDLSARHSIAALSRRCGYSRNHMRLLFQAEYGVSPLMYRNRARMSQARSLLVESDLSVKKVAALTGFRHVSHFCTMFRTVFHMTPREAMRRDRWQHNDPDR